MAKNLDLCHVQHLDLLLGGSARGNSRSLSGTRPISAAFIGPGELKLIGYRVRYSGVEEVFWGAAAPEIAIIATRGDAVGALAGGSQLGDFGEFIGEFIHDTTSR